MTFEKVKEIIVETINCNADDVVLEASLKDDLNVDSLDAVELNMALEEAFGITISDDDLMTFVLVKDIVEYVDKKAA
jgi:acyl carrier protein